MKRTIKHSQETRNDYNQVNLFVCNDEIFCDRDRNVCRFFSIWLVFFLFCRGLNLKLVFSKILLDLT